MQVWNNSQTKFSLTQKQQNTTEELPPGIFQIETTPVGWYLEKVKDSFTFPFKLYGVNSDIIDRVVKAWSLVPSNLGVLLSGLKGTGKSISTKMIANSMIAQGFPVILIQSNQDPISDVLNSIQQDVIVIFDEFEKMFSVEQQKYLLTLIDGITSSKYRRLFIFTVNTQTLDVNFLDRPSRIRYIWNFGNLNNKQILEIIDSELLPECSRFRSDILVYLSTRKFITVDIVKSVLQEVNLFHETISSFSEFFNVSGEMPKFVDFFTEIDGKIYIAEKCSITENVSRIFTKQNAGLDLSEEETRKVIYQFSSYDMKTDVDILGYDTKQKAFIGRISTQIPLFTETGNLTKSTSSKIVSKKPDNFISMRDYIQRFKNNSNKLKEITIAFNNSLYANPVFDEQLTEITEFEYYPISFKLIYANQLMGIVS